MGTKYTSKKSKLRKKLKKKHHPTIPFIAVAFPLRLDQNRHARVNRQGESKREKHRQTVAPHLLQYDPVANVELDVLPLETVDLRMVRHVVLEEHGVLQHEVANDRYHYCDVADDEVHQGRVRRGRADG